MSGPPERRIRIYRERRVSAASGGFDERRRHCWDLEACASEVRATCHAYIVQENCWDFWTIRGAKYRSCCYKRDDCRECPLVAKKFDGELPIYVRPVARPAAQPPVAALACRHLHLIGAEQPDQHALRQVLHDQTAKEFDTFRCRLRGVHLHTGYVADICAAGAGRDCVFL